MKKLLGYIIDGKTVGTELSSWSVDDLGGNVPFKISDTVDTGYADISSIENYDEFGACTGKDYKYIRSCMKEFMLSIVHEDFSRWNDLSLNEKKVAIKYLVSEIPVYLTTQVYSIPELRVIGLEFHKNSLNCRDTRFNVCCGELFSRLSVNDANDIINDMDSCYDAGGREYCLLLGTKYIRYGREGTVEGDPEGLFDYLEARTGTSFETWGLAAKSITPNYGTLQDCVDSLMDILKNGNY